MSISIDIKFIYNCTIDQNNYCFLFTVFYYPLFCIHYLLSYTVYIYCFVFDQNNHYFVFLDSIQAVNKILSVFECLPYKWSCLYNACSTNAEENYVCEKTFRGHSLEENPQFIFSSWKLCLKFLAVSRDLPVLVDHLDSMLEGELILHVTALVKDRSHRHLPGHVLPPHRRHEGQGGHHHHHHLVPRQVEVEKVHSK